MDFCFQYHQIDMPESVKKDSDIHINFAKSADFIFAEIEV